MATYAQYVEFGPYFSGASLCTLKVYHYITGTTTLKDVYTDRAKTTGAAQPVVSDANGIVSFYADGIYKFRIDASTDGVSYSTLYTNDAVAVTDQSGALSGEGEAIASASTLTLGPDGNFFHVTGANAITSISGLQDTVTLVFDSIPTLTHSGSLILQGSINYTAVAGDVFVFVNEGVSVWREQSRRLATSYVITKRKTNDESVAASTTLQNDDHLTFAIAANEEWIAQLYVSAGALVSTTGFKFHFSVPSGATILYTANVNGNVGDVSSGGFETSPSGGIDISAASMGAATSATVIGHLWILNGATPGSVTFQWAQSTSNATAVTVRKGSCLIARRIA